MGLWDDLAVEMEKLSYAWLSADDRPAITPQGLRQWLTLKRSEGERACHRWIFDGEWPQNPDSGLRWQIGMRLRWGWKLAILCTWLENPLSQDREEALLWLLDSSWQVAGIDDACLRALAGYPPEEQPPRLAD